MNVRNQLLQAALASMCLATSIACAGEPGSTATLAPGAPTVNTQKLAGITPGVSTKAQVRALLGAPWRVLQFNDCGMAPEGQSDETWEYRGSDGSGTYRVHVEFDEHSVTHLIARIPDSVPGGKGTAAKAAPIMMAHNAPM